MENYVIAITRTCGSGATTISKRLAEDLKIHMYDRELLRIASDQSGISEELFARADETVKKSLLYIASKRVYQGELIGPESDDFTSNDNLFNFQAKVLKELAENESYICIGRAADFVLKDNPRMISVFLYASPEVCLEHEMELNGFDRKRAEQYIQQTNRYRRDYYRYHTGKEWESPYNYDLCLNTGVFTYEQCVAIIKNYIKTRLGEL